MHLPTSENNGEDTMLIGICEDESAFAGTLGAAVKTFMEEKERECKINFYSCGKDLLEVMDGNLQPDLLFMDIQLGDMDGVDVIHTVRSKYPNLPVVFITSMENRALDGYDVNAFSFIYKRNFMEKLPRVLERFLTECYDSNNVTIKDKGGMQVIPIKNIYWVEADNRNTKIVTGSAEYTDAESIQHFADKLPKWLFVEAYHALFVNVDHIRRVEKDTVILDDDRSLPVSRRNRKDVMSAIMSRLSKL